MWRRPTAEQLKGSGLKPKHYREPNVDVWPENWPAIEMYVQYRTQWIQGPGGPTGLNYQVLFDHMDRQGIKDRDALMDAVRVIEDSVLARAYENK